MPRAPASRHHGSSPLLLPSLGNSHPSPAPAAFGDERTPLASHPIGSGTVANKLEANANRRPIHVKLGRRLSFRQAPSRKLSDSISVDVNTSTSDSNRSARVISSCAFHVMAPLSSAESFDICGNVPCNQVRHHVRGVKISASLGTS